MTVIVFSNFKFNFDCTVALFYKSKINSHGVYVTKKKTREEYFIKLKKRRCINVNSHFNNSKTNNLNTSNSDNSIGNSNLTCINVHIKNPLNKVS